MLVSTRTFATPFFLALFVSAASTSAESIADEGLLEVEPGVALSWTSVGEGPDTIIVPMGRIVGDMTSLTSHFRVISCDPHIRRSLCLSYNDG